MQGEKRMTARREDRKKFVVDRDRCRTCWSCVSVCPMMIYEKEDKAVRVVEERTALCIGCGHCMAVCREKAVSVPTLSYERDFTELPATKPSAEDFLRLIRTRRSVRVFKKDPVDASALEEIVRQISFAPMGFPPQNVEVTVVKERATIEKALPHIVDLYGKLIGWLKNPVTRFIVKRRVPLDVFNTLCDHIAPTYAMELEIMKRTGQDVITYGAPALLLFHARRGAGCHTENIYIALAFGLLAAHAMGLGATAIGLIPPAVEQGRGLKKLFGIPADNEVLASMIVGHPKVTFRRCIRRDLKKVNWV
jgi:ferredoxin